MTLVKGVEVGFLPSHNKDSITITAQVTLGQIKKIPVAWLQKENN